ncbi:MAG: septum formation initiator family protein [Pikeienuella sp.]
MPQTALARVIGPFIYAVILAGIGSFVYSGLRGDRGLQAQAAARAEITALEAALFELKATRQAEENRVRRLTRGYLDLDLLDERARSELGLARPDEVVIRPVSR